MKAAAGKRHHRQRTGENRPTGKRAAAGKGQEKTGQPGHRERRAIAQKRSPRSVAHARALPPLGRSLLPSFFSPPFCENEVAELFHLGRACSKLPVKALRGTVRLSVRASQGRRHGLPAGLASMARTDVLSGVDDAARKGARNLVVLSRASAHSRTLAIGAVEKGGGLCATQKKAACEPAPSAVLTGATITPGSRPPSTVLVKSRLASRMS